MKDTNTMVLVILGALVIGAAGFFVGRHTDARFGRQWVMGDQQANTRMGLGRGGKMGGGEFRGRGMMGGGAGEITKIEGTTITLKLADDTVKEVTLSEDAAVKLMTDGKVTDLKVGQTIMVAGGGFWSDGETVIVKP